MSFMNSIFITIILFVLAGGVFFGFTDPQYASIQALTEEREELDRATEKMRELNEERVQLQEERNQFSPDDLDRLHKALPDNVDNVKLVNDLNGIAERYNMTVRNARVVFETNSSGDIVVDENMYGVVSVQFSVSGPYQTFLSFLRKLEQNLRIVDIVNVSFSSSGDSDFYEYQISLKTYWLR
jgi:Tfp pilus assembly protein PilO